MCFDYQKEKLAHLRTGVKLQDFLFSHRAYLKENIFIFIYFVPTVFFLDKYELFQIF